MEVIINGTIYVPYTEPAKDKSLLSALEIRFDSDAGENITIRDYLWTLLDKFWREEEGFNSKRPFGNSGWKYEVSIALLKNGFIKGELIDEEDNEWDYDYEEADDYVLKLIKAAFYGVTE